MTYRKIEGRPTYASIKLIWDTIETNLINLTDARDPTWGKLHLIRNTSVLVNGPGAAVAESTNQEQPNPWVAPVTPEKEKNTSLGISKRKSTGYVIKWRKRHVRNLSHPE